MTDYNEAEGYFDFTFWRIGFALGSYWKICNFPSSKWYRLGLGWYWRYE